MGANREDALTGQRAVERPQPLSPAATTTMDGLTRRDQLYQQLGAVTELVANPQTWAERQEEPGAAQPTAAARSNPRRGNSLAPTSASASVDHGDGNDARTPGSALLRRSSTAGPVPLVLDRLTSSFMMALQNSPRNGMESSVGSSSNARSPYLVSGPVRVDASLGSGSNDNHPTVQGATAATYEPFNLSAAAATDSSNGQEPHPQAHNYPRTPSLMSGFGSGAPSRRASITSTLPGYARADPTSTNRVIYRHTLATPSKKLTIVLDSIGSKSHPVYVQGVYTKVTGKVILALQGDETVTELRLRVKGTVTTAVNRAHSTSHRSVAEEAEFWYASKLLWHPTEETPTLDAAARSLEFPFELEIPSKVPATGAMKQSFPMPPSFVLGRGKPHEIGGVEAAAVRYYVKVTLARKGLLRPNERLFAPIVYYPRRQSLLFMSDARRQAIVLGTDLPGPSVAPAAWEGKVEEKVIRKGFWGTKKVPYKVAMLLPSPLTYGKIESIPYYVKVTSSDSSMLSKLAPASVQVNLTQRTMVSAQGSAGVQEGLIDRGVTEAVLEENQTSADGDQVRRFRGKLSLKKANANSFYCPNMEVLYQITCQLVESGQVQETMIAVPITIVSIPPVARVSAPSIIQDHLQDPPPPISPDIPAGAALNPHPSQVPAAALPIPGTSTFSLDGDTSQAIPSSPTDGYDLPPSYFQVIERGLTRE